ncbi:MAG: ccsB [Aeromicrobium sp.]|jgi:cytochrome c-type biogenesis protein CcsB|nr:ccsB [Aeromicrobium sp.]
MTLAQYEQISNYAVASATVILGLAFIAYVAQWGFARNVAPDHALVEAGGSTSKPAGPAEEADRSDVAGGIGLSLTGLAWLVLLAGVIARGLSAQRVPWGNMYEFGCAGILVVLSAYLVLVRVWGIDWVGPIITGFGMVVLGLSALVWVPPGPLVPALHSYWLVIHVLGAMIAGSAFLVGAAASILFLLKSRAERITPVDEQVGFLWRIPPSAVIDKVAYRVHAFAFPIWTFAALIAGPIWAQYAWGKYWGWDPKEVWAFITWVVYACYLHARATAGWKGRNAAIIALIGFGCFLFNFIGVNLFIPGLHSYAK